MGLIPTNPPLHTIPPLAAATARCCVEFTLAAHTRNTAAAYQQATIALAGGLSTWTTLSFSIYPRFSISHMTSRPIEANLNSSQNYNRLAGTDEHKQAGTRVQLLYILSLPASPLFLFFFFFFTSDNYHRLSQRNFYYGRPQQKKFFSSLSKQTLHHLTQVSPSFPPPPRPTPLADINRMVKTRSGVMTTGPIAAPARRRAARRKAADSIAAPARQRGAGRKKMGKATRKVLRYPSLYSCNSF